MPSKQPNQFDEDDEDDHPANPEAGWRINEKAIVENLRTDKRGFTPAQVRFLCNMAILAGHERKIERNPMTEIINLANDIQCTLSDIEGAANLMMVMQQMFDHDTPKLMEALDANAKKLTALRYSLADKVELLIECAPPGTKLS